MSTSSLATVRSVARSVAISSRTGATILQVTPCLKKSASTGLLLDSTSVAKDASVALMVADFSENRSSLCSYQCVGTVSFSGCCVLSASMRGAATARCGNRLAIGAIHQVADAQTRPAVRCWW